MSSLVSILIPSASGCSRPNGPTRFGPGRFWTRPRTLRSTSVRAAKRLANTTMIAAMARRLLANQRQGSGREPVAQSRARAGARSRNDGVEAEALMRDHAVGGDAGGGAGGGVG